MCQTDTGGALQLGEVDHFLESAPGVQQSVTICAKVGGDDMLIAFLTPATVDTRAAKDALGKSVPAYMLPRSLFAVNSLPATASGKPDKKALLALFTGIATLAMGDTQVRLGSVRVVSFRLDSARLGSPRFGSSLRSSRRARNDVISKNRPRASMVSRIARKDDMKQRPRAAGDAERRQKTPPSRPR